MAHRTLTYAHPYVDINPRALLEMLRLLMGRQNNGEEVPINRNF